MKRIFTTAALAVLVLVAACWAKPIPPVPGTHLDVVGPVTIKAVDATDGAVLEGVSIVAVIGEKIVDAEIVTGPKGSAIATYEFDPPIKTEKLRFRFEKVGYRTELITEARLVSIIATEGLEGEFGPIRLERVSAEGED